MSSNWVKYVLDNHEPVFELEPLTPDGKVVNLWLKENFNIVSLRKHFHEWACKYRAIVIYSDADRDWKGVVTREIERDPLLKLVCEVGEVSDLKNGLIVLIKE